MSTYKNRMTPIWDQLKKGSTHEERAFNCSLMEESRVGDYLIKKRDKFECLAGIGYLDYSYRADGWGGWSKRENAQWFTKEEALELTKGWAGCKIVRRNH